VNTEKSRVPAAQKKGAVREGFEPSILIWPLLARLSSVDITSGDAVDIGGRYARCYAPMASIHKQPGRPHWFCAFTTADGKRVFRSTGTAQKKEALQICQTWDRAARVGRGGKLTPERAREIIAAGVADVFAAANRETLPGSTVRGWCERWLATKAIETEASTHVRYARVVERFLAFLGAAANRDLATLRPDDIARFRDSEAKEQARTTTNLSVKILRVCLGEAVRQEMIATNPAASVPVLKARGESKRRAFTVAEIQRVLAACNDDPEWRGLVLFGVYIGQRLGDLAKLTWRAIDLEAQEVTFIAKKTGKRLVLPLVRPLVDYLSTIPAGDDANAFIFPRAALANRTGTLSNRFRDVLVAAGLAEPRSHRASGSGRTAMRENAELSFHSLRHSAVTFLKAAGVSNALAMAIIGHESAAVSRSYTHMDTDDLRREMDKLPDVTTTLKRTTTKPRGIDRLKLRAVRKGSA
jgi:integrase